MDWEILVRFQATGPIRLDSLHRLLLRLRVGSRDTGTGSACTIDSAHGIDRNALTYSSCAGGHSPRIRSSVSMSVSQLGVVFGTGYFKRKIARLGGDWFAYFANDWRIISRVSRTCCRPSRTTMTDCEFS